MAKQVSLKTGCKVNLGLRITGVRKDGYHYIDSIFYPLPRPCDHIDILRSNKPGLRIKCCPPELEGTQNILHKTYDIFAQSTNFSPGLKVFLQKNVPIGAGLGGGSANAAAMLLLLNRLCGSRGLPKGELISLAAKIGGDVPFFIHNKPSRVRGIGETLSPVRLKLKGFKMLLICPGIHVDTAWAYRQWDLLQKKSVTDRTHSLTSTTTNDKSSPLKDQLVLSNSFEVPVFRAFPEIGKIKTRMLENGAAACVMSGSGSSLIAMFRDQKDVFRACAQLDRQSCPYFFYIF
ncbi:MAG: 4-(cytidine 5'-diphospho)-2-C-methyl-D-erythritol kinase [Desulfonatronovibrio sp. MSAO_Bac4]|nr:MAG: 4-(cytidine 5'-diphospho)-2-C-methyl-D-erythritol kinase [Desulfonatronovibrio sp. MSAO_Bac4]